MKDKLILVTLQNAVQHFCARFKSSKQQLSTPGRVTSADMRAYRHYLSNYQRQNMQS